MANRAAGRGCPYCSGKRVLAGYNDLATVRPDLAEQLVDKALATELNLGSNKKVQWRCGADHTWTTSPNKRTTGRGCPYCAGKRPALGETDLATVRPDLTADLVDLAFGTALTVNSNKKVWWRCSRGHQWEATVANRVNASSGCPYCAGKRAILGETDLATLRPDVAGQLVDPALGSQLTVSSGRRVEWRCDLGHVYTSRVADKSAGAGCPFCSGKAVLPGFNDLATVRPDLAAQLGDQILGTRLTVGSSKRVAWNCSLGHRYETAVHKRATRGDGCPYCSTPARRVLPGFNDLATTRPDLAAELVDQTLATKLTFGTPKKTRWRCAEGHEWTSSVSDRSFGNGCPECTKHGYSQVSSGWFYLLAMPGRRVLKFGIANDLDQRVNKHRRQGFTEVVETIYYDSGADALAAEGALIKHARAAGWGYGLSRSQMRDGWTETLLADDCGDEFTLSGFLAGLDP